MQISWDPAGELSPSEFFYALLDTMQDVLLVKDGNVKFDNKPQTLNEDMTPTLRSVVVKDWLLAMGGQQLFEHVCRVYSKDLEIGTLADIQHRITQNLDSLNSELESVTGAVQVMRVFNSREKSEGKQRQNQRKNFVRLPQRQKQANNTLKEGRKSGSKQRVCILCKAMGREDAMLSHTLASCYLVDQNDRSEMARIQRSIVPPYESECQDTSSEEEDVDQD